MLTTFGCDCLFFLPWSIWRSGKWIFNIWSGCYWTGEWFWYCLQKYSQKFRKKKTFSNLRLHSNENANGKMKTGHNFTVYYFWKGPKGLKFLADFPYNYHITLKLMGFLHGPHHSIAAVVATAIPLKNWHFIFTISLCKNRL